MYCPHVLPPTAPNPIPPCCNDPVIPKESPGCVRAILEGPQRAIFLILKYVIFSWSWDFICIVPDRGECGTHKQATAPPNLLMKKVVGNWKRTFVACERRLSVCLVQMNYWVYSLPSRTKDCNKTSKNHLLSAWRLLPSLEPQTLLSVSTWKNNHNIS